MKIYILSNGNNLGYFISKDEASNKILKYSEDYFIYEKIHKRYQDNYNLFINKRIDYKTYQNNFYDIRNSGDKEIYDKCAKIGDPKNLNIIEIDCIDIL